MARAKPSIGANSPSNVAQLLLHYLKLEKARCLFGVPGGAIARILQTLHEKEYEDFFKYIVCRHETGAAYIAEGYFRATGHPGVVLVTSGPGATNALTGALTAQFGGSAVITITGEPSEENLGRGYLQEGVETGLSISRIFTAATSYSAHITDPNSAKTLIEQAFRGSMSIPRRAVHLSIPDNIAGGAPQGLWATDPPTTTDMYRAEPRGVPSEEDVAEVGNLLFDAKRPLIFLGSGCRDALRDPKTLKALRDLVNKYQIPVMTTMDGKGVYPETDPMSLRTYGFASCRWPHQWLEPDDPDLRCDALVVIGSALGSLSTNKWHPMLVPRGPFIQVDIEQSVIGRAFRVTHGIVADAGKFIRSLVTDLSAREPNAEEVTLRKQAIIQIKKTQPIVQREDYKPYFEYWSDPYAEDDGEGIEPAALIRVVQEYLPDEGAMIFIDAGNCVGWGAHYLVVDPPNEYHSTLGMGPMGFGVGAVIGAKIGKNEEGKRDTVCLALVGDGAFLMHGNEISTAAAYGVGAIWIVLADNDLRMVTQGMVHYSMHDPKFDFEGHYNLGNPNLVKFAESLGADATEAKSQEQLRKAMESSLRGARDDRPQVIIAHVNPKRVPPYYLQPYLIPKAADYRREEELLSVFWSNAPKRGV